MRDSKKSLLVLMSLLFVACALALGVYYYQYNKTSTVFNEVTIPTDLVARENYIEDTGVPNQKRYVSKTKGISFVYLEEQGGETTKVEEQGNKIYLYGASYEPTSGQYVEVFSKGSQDSLLVALEKQFLENYSASDCEVYNSDSPSKYPESYEIANIRVAGGWVDMEDLFARYDKCPPIYTESNGLSFFLMDKNHPDKYLFFSIGQYGISGESIDSGGRAWQDTVEFLD